MDKILALYEYKEKIEGKDFLRVEEVFILKFLDGKNCLVARKGDYFAPERLEGMFTVGDRNKATGIATVVEVMPLESLVIIDKQIAPNGVIFRSEEKKVVF